MSNVGGHAGGHKEGERRRDRAPVEKLAWATGNRSRGWPGPGPPYLRAIALAGALILLLLLSTSLFEAFKIAGSSMEPTLLNGERVLVAKFAYGLFLPFRETVALNWASPRRGDVVVIKSATEGMDIIKRVIGIGGDLIEVKADRLYLNGEALPQQLIGKCNTGVGARQQQCMVYRSQLGEQVFETSSARFAMAPLAVNVPLDHVFLLGDRRDFSIDSRSPGVGPVPVNWIKGKVISIYWSKGDNGLRWARMPKTMH